MDSAHQIKQMDPQFVVSHHNNTHHPHNNKTTILHLTPTIIFQIVVIYEDSMDAPSNGDAHSSNKSSPDEGDQVCGFCCFLREFQSKTGHFMATRPF